MVSEGPSNFRQLRLIREIGNITEKELVMHDIDRTQREYHPEIFESESHEAETFESESFEAEAFEFGEAEWSGELSGEAGFNEAELMELAGELLEVNSEAELEQFLGKLIKRAARTVGSVVRSPIGQALGGVLKSVAKKALPLAGGALGAWVGGPLGAKIGSGLASAAGSALGLEAEMLEQEDREFEGAKQFVQLAANTVRNAAATPASANPRAAAQAAAIAAARQLAPGLIRPIQTTPPSRRRRPTSGRWYRRGNTLVLQGT